MTAYDIFIRLVQEIGPLQYDDFVAKTIEGIIERPLLKDEHGNYSLQIGDTRTCYAAHLDTVAPNRLNPLLYQAKNKEGDTLVFTAGTSVLGADDRAGCAVLCWMIRHNAPGLYYFFTGEEVGQIGSGLVAYDKTLVGKIDHIIEFDRYGYTSIITHQSLRRTASDEFAVALASQLDNAGLPGFVPDDGGSFTDSEAFKETIAECTNVSVGYYSQHSSEEYQNVTFLQDLCNAMLLVDATKLPATRQPLADPWLRDLWNYRKPMSEAYDGWVFDPTTNDWIDKDEYKRVYGMEWEDTQITQPDNSVYEEWLEALEVADYADNEGVEKLSSPDTDILIEYLLRFMDRKPSAAVAMLPSDLFQVSPANATAREMVQDAAAITAQHPVTTLEIISESWTFSDLVAAIENIYYDTVA